VSLPEPLAVTLRVAHACARLGLRYLIGGSLASSFQGRRLDVGYLRRWAAHLRVADLLERALAEAGLDP